MSDFKQNSKYGNADKNFRNKWMKEDLYKAFTGKEHEKHIFRDPNGPNSRTRGQALGNFLNLFKDFFKFK